MGAAKDEKTTSFGGGVILLDGTFEKPRPLLGRHQKLLWSLFVVLFCWLLCVSTRSNRKEEKEKRREEKERKEGQTRVSLLMG